MTLTDKLILVKTNKLVQRHNQKNEKQFIKIKSHHNKMWLIVSAVMAAVIHHCT